MTDPESRRKIVDDEHLRLLSIAYVISGIMTALFSLMGLLYAGMGLLMNSFFAAAARESTHPEKMPPESLGMIVSAFGGFFFLVLISLALAKFLAASRIRQRRSRMFCLVVAGISCLGIPYGTILGVCSFIVLGRDSVAAQFDAPAAPVVNA
ncbi:MAG TPA: hypothetical protein PLR28_01145 [Dokdonella sp.]|nr:hypothetical protein [Dokdonella sp.]